MSQQFSQKPAAVGQHASPATSRPTAAHLACNGQSPSVVGDNDGIFVGTEGAVGLALGDCEGGITRSATADGDRLGLVEGDRDGDMIGESDGDALGLPVGALDGLAFGLVLGLVLGLDVGVALGDSLGYTVGVCVLLQQPTYPMFGCGQHKPTMKPAS